MACARVLAGWLLILMVLNSGAASGQSLVSDNCIERGGSDLCVPSNKSQWCYSVNPRPFLSDPPLRPIGHGIYSYCYLSEQESLDAFFAYYTGMRLVSLYEPTRALGWTNGEVMNEVTRYLADCSGSGGLCSGPTVVEVYRGKYYACSVPNAQSSSDDPLAPSYFYRDYRHVCRVSTIIQNEESCPVGNPIHIAEGRKVERAIDYLSAGVSPLRFERFYDSGGTFWNGAQFLGDKWSTEHAAVFFPPTGTSWTSALVRYGNSAADAYGRQPPFAPVAAAKGKLAWEVDSLGNPTAWHHYGKDGKLRRFSPTGSLLSESSAGGKTLRYSYDASPTQQPPCQTVGNNSGALRCITDDFGRQLNFEYDSNNRLTAMLDAAGNSTYYRYNEAGFFRPGGTWSAVLTSVAYPDGGKRAYHYNEPEHMGASSTAWALTGISDQTAPNQLQRLATFKYDGNKRPTYTSHAGGAGQHSVSYYSSTSRIVTDPLGTSRTISFQLSANAWRQTSATQPAGAGSGPCAASATYDQKGNQSSRTDYRGYKTCYSYESNRNVEVKRVEGLAANADCASALTSPPAGARVITTQWHPEWRFETRIAEPKLVTTINYNGQGANVCAPSTVSVDGKPPAVVCSRVEQATTDESGAAGFAATASGTARTWSWAYTTYGRVLTATDPNGKTTTTTYYADNDPDMGRRGNVATITNPAGQVTRYAAYNLHGQVTQIVDPNGLTTDLTYDARMRLTSRKVGNELTSLVYDPRGLLSQMTFPDGASLTYTYDAALRVIGIEDHKGSRVVYALDAMGNRINEQMSDPGGTLVRNIQRSIDALNRVQQVVGSNQ